jgi:hypothetical protein
MLSLKTNLKKSASDPLEIPAILRRDGPAVKTNPDAAVIKAAKVTITTVPPGLTAAKVEKAAKKTAAKKSTKARVIAKEIEEAKKPEPKKPTKKQVAADDAVKSVAEKPKAKSKMPPVGKLAYDWAAAETLAKAGKPFPLGPWKSYDGHMKEARELALKGDFDGAEKIMSGHRNVAANRDQYYGLIRTYIKAKKS